MSLSIRSKDDLDFEDVKSKSYMNLYNPKSASKELVRSITDLHYKLYSATNSKGHDMDSDFMRGKVKEVGYEVRKNINFSEISNSSKYFIFQYSISGIKDHGGETDIDCIIVNGKNIYVVELKSGGELDSEKGPSVVSKLNDACQHIRQKVPSDSEVDVYNRIVFWHSKNITNSHIGGTGDEYLDWCMTGKEFCDQFRIQFTSNVQDSIRTKNVHYVVEKCKNILDLHRECYDKEHEDNGKIKNWTEKNIAIKA